MDAELLGIGFSLEVLELVFIGLSIPFLLAGTFVKTRSRHLLMLTADVLFAISWLFLVPYYSQIPDWINVLLVIGAALLFGYLAFHEALNFLYNEELAALDWLSHVGIWTTAGYFIISKVGFLSSGLIWFVVTLSVGILQVFGYDVQVGAPALTSHPGGVCYPVEAGFDLAGATPISIILACTGLQASLLLLTGVLFAKPNKRLWEKWAQRMRQEYAKKYHEAGILGTYYYRWRYRHIRRLQERSGLVRKAVSILLVVPAVFIANLLRNAGVIFVVYEGYMSFDLSHNIIAKFYAGAVLVVLVLIVFDNMPEVQENIMTLKDMALRFKPAMVENGYIVLPKTAQGPSRAKDADEQGSGKARAKKVQPGKKKGAPDHEKDRKTSPSQRRGTPFGKRPKV